VSTLHHLPPLDLRLPAWDVADLQERTCPFCAAEGDARWVRPDGLTVRRCADCATLFVAPAPSSEQLAAFYARYDVSHRRYADAGVDELRAFYLAKAPTADFRIRELASMVQLSGLRVLDIGCGRGEFLFQLQRLGAIAHGLELDTRAIELAGALGLTNVRLGSLADCASSEAYDLVVLNDVIEHPLAPLTMLEQARDVLRPGGRILIWTPNGELASRETTPTALRVDLEHMQYLSPSTCLRVANLLGLGIVHLETCGVPHLDGIDEDRSRLRRIKQAAKHALRQLPGFTAARSLRQRLAPTDERSGAYHLFCMLQRP
jgi:2-polyprenyl-3-methyl-5-hydroxy-6-metoxy-1,4-benzoquinol methylase